MIDEGTSIEGIRRLTPGNYIKLENNKLTNNCYHKFDFSDHEMTFDDAIELVDNGFRRAVKRCFDKDIEYDSKEHLVDISAGLDSRMTNWVARDLGYEKFFNISYSQSDSDELSYSSKVALTLGNQFIHLQLDDVNFIYDIDEFIEFNYGLAVYCGLSGGKQILDHLNMKKFVLEHTGQIGDIVIGSACNTDYHIPISTNSKKWRYSNLIDLNIPEDIVKQYSNDEDFVFMNRAFRCCLSSHFIRRHFCYTVSPFMDVDFMQLCMNIPMRFRKNHNLYWAWIDKKYSLAGQLPSSRIRGKRTLVTRALGRLNREFRKILYRLGFLRSKTDSNNMNPYDYWYETNPKLREFIENYFAETRSLVDGYPQIAKNIDTLYKFGNTIDKTLVLTVLGVFKHYFS